MARLLTRTLTLPRPAPAVGVPSSRALSKKVEFVEIDLSEESVANAAARLRKRRVEDAIRKVILRRFVPVWLPFVPGGSYWVPPLPRRPLSFADLQAVSMGGALVSYSSEEAMCFTSVRGWPSAKYFVEGKFPHPVKRSRRYATQTDDEDS